MLTLLLKLMLMAAKIQKQKDEELARQSKAAADVMTLQPLANATTQKHVSIDENFAPRTEQTDVCGGDTSRLLRISDQIDECLARAQRVEQHWNDNVERILALLQSQSYERKSYV